MKGLSGTRKLLDVVRAYMRKGGFHVQFNVVGSDTLRAAQKKPEARPERVKAPYGKTKRDKQYPKYHETRETLWEVGGTTPQG